jgi:DNA modification methylase
MPIDKLDPAYYNPRKDLKPGDPEYEKLKKSIQEFDLVEPLVWNERTSRLIGGHQRLKVLQELGYTKVEVSVVDLPEEKEKALNVALNKIQGDWDYVKLKDLLEELDTGEFDLELTGFDMDEIEDLMTQFHVPEEIIEDEVPEPPEEPITQPGDLWILGRHRLLCGDATKKEDVERLMDGKKADMVFTDPPYNIASDSKNVAADCSRSMYKLSKSEWDKNFDINELFPCLFDAIAEDCTVYICTSHFLAGDIWKWMKEWAAHYSYCVWSKPNPMPSLTKRHWTWNTELVCYATRGKHIFHFPKEGHALSTWTINKKNGGTVHPTEKPVEVPSTAISFSSNEHQCVLDLFGGSGSTLIACEQLNRTCYMMELDPIYCDVIVQRYINLKGHDGDVYLERDGNKIAFPNVTT